MKPILRLVFASAAAVASGACANDRPAGHSPPIRPAPVVAQPDPAPAPVQPAAPPAAPQNPRNYVTYTVKVTGMTCPIRCAKEVRDQLLAVPGVLHVDIDQDERKAMVDVVPGTDPETIVHGLKSPYAGRLL